MNSKAKQNKAFANVKIQPPLLALTHVALAFMLTWLVPLPLIVPPILRVGGFLLVILGFLLGIGALIAFRSARTLDNHPESVARLVTFGIYNFTRNPVYLGFLLMQVGIPLNAGSYWGIVLAPIMIILFNRFVIEQEEEYLVYKFGGEYRAYSSKVRRWL